MRKVREPKREETSERRVEGCRWRHTASLEAEGSEREAEIGWTRMRGEREREREREVAGVSYESGAAVFVSPSYGHHV